MAVRGRAHAPLVALVLALGVLGQTSASSAQTGGAAAQPSGAPRAREHAYPSTASLGTLPPDVGVPSGARAPDAELRDASGRAMRLRDLMKGGPVLLVFYRGGWCPYCNFQVRELTAAYPEYRRRGITPVAVSVDRAEESATTVATYAVPFPVLSDPDLAAHRAYRVLHRVARDEQARLASFGIDLEHASGRSHHVIAVPAIFVVDTRGVVRWAHADKDYKVRPSTAQILTVIDGLDLAAR